MNKEQARGFRASNAVDDSMGDNERTLMMKIMESVVRYADRAGEVRSDALRKVSKALADISTMADIDNYKTHQGETNGESTEKQYKPDASSANGQEPD